MKYATLISLYFIFWWITLFAILPLGLHTQADDKHVVRGTMKSAPSQFHARRIFTLTTVVSAILFVIWYIINQVYGIGADSIPRIVPNF